MDEKEIQVGTDLNDFPGIGVYEQNPELAEVFKKAMKESPHMLVIQKKPRWIPCSKRMPDGRKCALITYGDVIEITFFDGYD